MKKQVMEMLEQFLMGREGSKFAPKAVHVEMMTAKPVKGKEGLKEVLEDAAEENPIENMSHEDMEEVSESPEEERREHQPGGSEEDEEEEEVKPKGMTLREFLESRS